MCAIYRTVIIFLRDCQTLHVSNATWWQRLFGMAQILLKPPDSFNFQTPDDWPRWIARFVQFRAAACLAADSDEKQVNTLLYCMGEGAAAVLASTNITAEERKDYLKVVEKFDAFFRVSRNVFNRRHQREGEPVDTYIMELYKL